jgi:Ca2+-binding EF-hand superfamily protein
VAVTVPLLLHCRSRCRYRKGGTERRAWSRLASMGDVENSLHLDHDQLRSTLNPKYFGPATPRQERLNRSKNSRHHNLRKQVGVHSAAPRPSTSGSIGLDVSDLDFSITKSTVAKPWAHASATGARGTTRGITELKAEVLLRDGLRTNIKASRALTFDRARPHIAEFIRLREPPTREEIDSAMEEDPVADVEKITSVRARRLTQRLLKRFENKLPELLHHLEQRYGERPLPEKVPHARVVIRPRKGKAVVIDTKRDQAKLAQRIAMSQTYLKADQTAVQVAATRDRGLRTAKSLDTQDLQHPGLVSGLADLGFSKYTPQTVGASKAVEERMRSMLRPDHIAIGRRVDKTLDEVKEAYFPPSLRWRSRQEQPAEPAHVRRVSRGSMVVYAGQGTSYRVRHHNEARHITQLQKQCVLGLDEINQIKQIVSSLTDDANPQISFSRFLSIMKAIGVGGGAAEVDFFGRLYKVFDADHNGSVEFDELVDGLSVLAAGSAKDKLRMYYKMFSIVAATADAEGDAESDKEAEVIQREGLRRYQVQRMMLTLVQHLGGGGEDGFSNEDLKRMFTHADTDGDGDIDFDELYDFVARHPALIDFIAKSSIVFNSGLREEQEQAREEATTFHDELLKAEDESDDDEHAELPEQADASAWSATPSANGAEVSMSPSEFMRSRSEPDLSMDARHTFSSRRKHGALSNAAANRSRYASLGDATLWEQRKAARQPQPAKLQTGVRASYRSQGVTGFLAMGARGMLSNMDFDESAERAAVDQKASESRAQIVAGSHSTSQMLGGADQRSLNQSRIAAPESGSYEMHNRSFSSGAR